MNATQTFEQMTRDERWGGWGYLGERERNADHPNRDAADAYILAWAAERGWSAEDLFTFVNSRNGRKFGDLVFGGWRDWQEQARTWGILRPVYN